MNTEIAYRASYIAEPTDHSLDAIRHRLTPLAKSVGYEDVTLSACCGGMGTRYHAYAHGKLAGQCVALVHSPMGENLTLAELEDQATIALYATLGQGNTGSL